MLIANWSLPHSPVYLPIYLNIQVEKKEYLHKEIEDKDGQPKVFLIPYTPEIAAKCIFDTIDNDLYSKSGSEGSPNLISTKLLQPHEVLYMIIHEASLTAIVSYFILSWHHILCSRVRRAAETNQSRGIVPHFLSRLDLTAGNVNFETISQVVHIICLSPDIRPICICSQT